MDRDHQRVRIPFFRRKISFFAILFLTINGTLIVLSGMQYFLFSQGIDRSVKGWENARKDHIYQMARDYLIRGDERVYMVPEPITIYDLNKRIIFSNRKGRMQRMPHHMEPVKHKGDIVGYLGRMDIRFRMDKDNREFVDSLIRNLTLSTIISFLLSLIISWVVSRKIASATVKLKQGIMRIHRGELGYVIPPGGPREISEITELINIFSRELKEEKTLRDQWLHDIAHDLKTPVAALNLQFEGIEAGVLDLSMERIIRNRREIDRLSHLIDGLNSLMKVESPDYNLNKADIQGKEFFKRITDTLEARALKKEVVFIIKDEGSSWNGDEELLFRALFNIVNNALEYCYTGTSVILTSEMKGDSVTISVENKGQTIEEDQLKRIFDRLYRGDSSRNSEGSGLGLSISRAIIRKHRGEIMAESASSVTRFIVTLPLV